jgi:CRP/FNR family transcriptional regulator
VSTAPIPRVATVLPPALAAPLATLAQQRTHKRRHEFLFHMGDQVNDRFYAIESGSWKCGTVSQEGEQDVIGFLGRGACLGLDERHAQLRSYGAVALSNSTVLEFSRTRVLQAAEQDGELRAQIQTLFLEEIARQQRIAQIQRSPHARQRVAAFLLELANAELSNGFDGKHFQLVMSRSDIAAFLAMADTTASRELQRLAHSGAVCVRGRWVSVLDAGQLQQAAGQ